MAAMKVTTSAAMRARDVSRPHAEHLAFAEAAEVEAPEAVDVPARVDEAGANAVPGDEVLRDGMGGTRRRWRPRGSGRGRASSR